MIHMKMPVFLCPPISCDYGLGGIKASPCPYHQTGGMALLIGRSVTLSPAPIARKTASNSSEAYRCDGLRNSGLGRLGLSNWSVGYHVTQTTDILVTRQCRIRTLQTNITARRVCRPQALPRNIHTILFGLVNRNGWTSGCIGDSTNPVVSVPTI